MGTAVSRRTFGHLTSGEPVFCFTLQSEVLIAEVITYGACIVSVQAPDRTGEAGHVVLGSYDLEEYTRKDKAYLGAVCGRYAGRIAGACVEIDGETYNLYANDAGRATLHGGAEGFDARNWSAEVVTNGVRLSLVSPDGDQGFPGELRTIVTYELEGNTLRMDLEARTSAPTFLNLTSHAYFNLDGKESRSICDHTLQLRSDTVLAQDENFLPTGTLLRVENGAAFDFSYPKKLGECIEELRNSSKGYNHTFLLKGERVLPAARLVGKSGRALEIFTSEPAVQVYSAGYFTGTQKGFSGCPYGPEAGIALETQHCPDSPHHLHFPSTLLRPHEVFRSETIWKFVAG